MKKITLLFWVGKFETEDGFFDFFAEDDDYYNEENDTEEKFLSAFAQSQGETWLDHDLMEPGFSTTGSSFKEKFKSASYASNWADALQLRSGHLNIDAINTVVMMDQGEIEAPRSVKGDGFFLEYIGEIEFTTDY